MILHLNRGLLKPWHYTTLSFHKLPHTLLLSQDRELIEGLYQNQKRLDETKILHAKGKYYYLWVIVDLDTRKVVKFYIASVRSDVNMYKIIN